MSQQDQINALTARLQAVATNVAALEANSQPPVDLTALTNEVTAVEAQVNQGLPAAPTPPAPPAA
jgi:hypothetical protein